MRLSHLKILLFSALLVVCAVAAGHALEVPPLKGRVNDYGNLLSPQTVQALEQKLAAFERETTNQLVVLTVPSLQDETIEGYAIKVGDAWKIGQHDKGNGVMLILAKKERKIRIEVGTGLQGALPDITAGQIIRNVMAPHLKAGNFDAGIAAGLDAVIAATKGEFKATSADRKAVKKKKNSGYGLFMMLALAGIVVVAVAGASSRTAGTLTGGVALPLAVELSLGAGYSTILLLGLLGGAAGFLISLLMHLFNASGGGGFGGGGPTIFYGGGGGYSSGGDSFGGGGGGFDGGGSSDDW
ncbi:MAG: TPM domain-containing protein [Trichlorobacter sp.]|jgi:uncharacterized protein